MQAEAKGDKAGAKDDGGMVDEEANAVLAPFLAGTGIGRSEAERCEIPGEGGGNGERDGGQGRHCYLVLVLLFFLFQKKMLRLCRRLPTVYIY